MHRQPTHGSCRLSHFFGGLGPNATRNGVAGVCFAGLLILASGPAKAADGCLVLLCLTAPSWSNVARCIDPVREVLRDLARGRPFPSCPAGPGNHAANRWSTPPDFCPVQYTHANDLESGTRYACDYDAAVTVDVNGALWSRTWWRLSGSDTVTEFSVAAKAQLGTWNARFDDDYARWLATRAPTPSSCTMC